MHVWCWSAHFRELRSANTRLLQFSKPCRNCTCQRILCQVHISKCWQSPNSTRRVPVTQHYVHGWNLPCMQLAIWWRLDIRKKLDDEQKLFIDKIWSHIWYLSSSIDSISHSHRYIWSHLKLRMDEITRMDHNNQYLWCKLIHLCEGSTCLEELFKPTMWVPNSPLAQKNITMSRGRTSTFIGPVSCTNVQLNYFYLYTNGQSNLIVTSTLSIGSLLSLITKLMMYPNWVGIRFQLRNLSCK